MPPDVSGRFDNLYRKFLSLKTMLHGLPVLPGEGWVIFAQQLSVPYGASRAELAKCFRAFHDEWDVLFRVLHVTPY